MRIALKDVHRDRTAVVDARHAADDFTQPALPHLLLRAKKTFLVAAAVSDAEIAARASHGVEHRVGVAQRERDRLLDENGFTQLERAPHRRRMLAFGCRDDYGRHFRTLDDFGVVRRNELRACQFGETARTRNVPIRHRQISHRRMLRSETRAQRPDAPGTHDGKPDVLPCSSVFRLPLTHHSITPSPVTGDSSVISGALHPLPARPFAAGLVLSASCIARKPICAVIRPVIGSAQQIASSTWRRVMPYS